MATNYEDDPEFWYWMNNPTDENITKIAKATGMSEWQIRQNMGLNPTPQQMVYDSLQNIPSGALPLVGDALSNIDPNWTSYVDMPYDSGLEWQTNIGPNTTPSYDDTELAAMLNPVSIPSTSTSSNATSVAALAGDAGPGGTAGLKPVESVGIKEPGLIDKGIDWLGDKAGDALDWTKKNAATLWLGGTGALLAGAAGAVTGAKVGDKIDTSRENKQNKLNNIDSELTNYFGDIDKAESDLKTDNFLQGVVNTPVDPLTAFNQPKQSSTDDFLQGVVNTPVDPVSTSFLPTANKSGPSKTNVANNTIDSINAISGWSPLNIQPTPINTSEADYYTPATSLINNNYGLTGGSTPQNNLNTPIVGNQPVNTVAETIVNPTENIQPSNTSVTQGSGINAGSLPQFRKELNSALANAKRLSIQRARPLSENEISGAVEGLASGATGRLRDAEQMQLAREGLALDRDRFEADKASDAERIQILKDQMATAKDQWERGFLSDTEYRDKVLELQLEWAEKGYNLDLDYNEKAEDNADIGNILGAINLISELF